MADNTRQPHPYSGEWWATRTTAELEASARDNMTGSPAHEDARRELDRRKGQARERVDRVINIVGMVAAVVAAVASVILLF